MTMNLHNLSWYPALAPLLPAGYENRVAEFLQAAYADGEVLPPRDLVYAAYDATPLTGVKVVILGQDPYPTPGNAQGLSFSVPENHPLPKSLVNIYRELSDDLQAPAPTSGDLHGWARQGVLLLNTVLTVPANQAGGHAGLIWETLTDATIQLIAQQPQPTVFILWGKHAQAKQPLIQGDHNLVLTAAHPSPLSAYRGFWGSHPFSKTNTFLVENHVAPIDWLNV